MNVIYVFLIDLAFSLQLFTSVCQLWPKYYQTALTPVSLIRSLLRKMHWWNYTIYTQIIVVYKKILSKQIIRCCAVLFKLLKTTKTKETGSIFGLNVCIIMYCLRFSLKLLNGFKCSLRHLLWEVLVLKLLLN